MMAWIDGRFVASGELPRPDPGRLSPFETMGARDGQVPLWERHLRRLLAAAARVGLPFAAGTELRAAAGELLLGTGHADGILRLQLLPVGNVVHVAMTTRQRSPAATVRLQIVVSEHLAAPLADLKAAPRAFYDAVLQRAQDGGADDGILVAADGQALETATANLWVLQNGVWRTPPLDGRVLPGIARALLLERAAAAGVAAVEGPIDGSDLLQADALAVSNAVYGPRAAGLLDGSSPAVGPVDASLRRLWTA